MTLMILLFHEFSLLVRLNGKEMGYPVTRIMTVPSLCHFPQSFSPSFSPSICLFILWMNVPFSSVIGIISSALPSTRKTVWF